MAIRRIASWILLAALAFLVYGVMGASSFVRGPIPNLTMGLSILARCIMIGFPVMLLIQLVSQTGGANIGIAILGMLKGFLALYGPLALVALGLAAWVGSPSESYGYEEESPRRRYR